MLNHIEHVTLNPDANTGHFPGAGIGSQHAPLRS
jgi:hypothetical protein